MKQFSTLSVKTNAALKVKRHTVVFTGQQGNFDTSKGYEQEEVTFSKHITAQECEDLAKNVKT